MHVKLAKASASIAPGAFQMSIKIDICDQVAVVTLDRPEKKHAITTAMRIQLYETFEGLAEDNTVRAVVLTGSGGDFCSGMDVGEFGSHTLADRGVRTLRLQRISRAIYRLKKPTIAAVRGVCMGAGWSYALCCDFVIAAEDARFAQVFNRTALAPDAGSAWLLAQQVGVMKAKELCYSGRTISGVAAAELGLALKAVPADEVHKEAMALAQDLARGPTLAIAMAKRQFEVAATTSFDTFLEAEFAMPPLMQLTEDHEEGVAAFRERRAPLFRGT